MRSITSSKARTRWSKVLDLLVVEGPVAVTRHGRTVGVLWAPTLPAAPAEPARLPELARRYSAGELSWREIAAETDCAFGDLLEELGRQGLQLPRVTPEKRPKQKAHLHAIFRRGAELPKAEGSTT